MSIGPCNLVSSEDKTSAQRHWVSHRLQKLGNREVSRCDVNDCQAIWYHSCAEIRQCRQMIGEGVGGGSGG